MHKKALQCATLFGAAALASPVWAQDKVVQDKLGHEAIAQIHVGAFGGGEPVGATSFRVLSISGIEGKSVTGLPYSADETTTTTQTLPDGNRIVNTSKSKVYRDQLGRRRVEQTIVNTIGGTGGAVANETNTIVSIDDPVANVHYTLHPESRTADKIEVNGNMNSAMRVEVEQHAKEIMEMAQTKVMKSRDGSGGPVQGIIMNKTPVLAKAQGEVAIDDLGPQNMEGVMVQGKRTTYTIPAGTMGNERPIQISDERWYSPDLQMNIMTKHSDPRMGETVFTVTNVSRANPDLSLFQLPADYQVTNSKNMVYKINRQVTQ